jgi:hypothetical protein
VVGGRGGGRLISGGGMESCGGGGTAAGAVGGDGDTDGPAGEDGVGLTEALEGAPSEEESTGTARFPRGAPAGAIVERAPESV